MRKNQKLIVIVNPYYFLFYLFYKLLHTNAIKDRLPFSISTLKGLLLFTHLLIIALILQDHYGIFITLPQVDSYILSALSVIPYYIMNYFLFEKNSRWELLVENIEKEKNYKKIVTSFLLFLYFLIPLILYLRRDF